MPLASKLFRELIVAGIPVASVSNEGDIIYARTLTGPEIITANDIIAAHEPTDFDGSFGESVNQAGRLKRRGLGNLPASRMIYRVIGNSFADKRGQAQPTSPAEVDALLTGQLTGAGFTVDESTVLLDLVYAIRDGVLAVKG